ncbi:MAG: NADH:flavin oxidoreductase [Candidatus Bathyarchaeota archaeon]
MAFEKVMEPIKIKDLQVKNRVAVAPMNLTWSTQDGYATQQDIAMVARWAKGGFGLVITGAVIATKLASKFVTCRNLLLYDNSFIPGLGMMAEAVHAFGGKICMQISPGFGSQGRAPDGTPSYAPSAIPLYTTPSNILPKALLRNAKRWPAIDVFTNVRWQTPRAMTVAEIKSERKEWADACRRAVIAGYDCLEIHACHGYLCYNFLSPILNKRTDQYGGSLENRMRFTVEFTESALEAAKDAIPVGIRMSADEHMPGGFTLDEVKEVAKKLQGLGIAYFHLSDGPEPSKYMEPDSMEEVEQHLLKEAKSFKEVLSIPVITPSVHDPFVAERVISEGETDMIALGRQAIADPDWPNKVKEGNVDKIRRCKRDNMCFTTYLATRCSTNPEIGFEQYQPDLFPKRRGSIIPSGVAKLP